MSPPDLAGPAPGNEPIEQKQRANVYTMMLILAFAAICVACVLLWLELQEYGTYPWWRTSGIAPPTSFLYAPADPTLPVVTGWWA